jgi:sugar lactone lactonase YvrE
MDHFVAGTGLVAGIRDIRFQGGYMYVGAENTDEVFRFDATTGAFVDVFVTAGSGGIDGPHGMTFGPDVNADNVPELYVSGRNSFNIVRYDGATGLPLGTYVTPSSGGLNLPQGLTFDPAGSILYVTSEGSNQVLKYNAQNGAFLGVGASTGLSSPDDVKFGPDGLMYVSSGGNNRIIRFTAAGAYVDDYVPAGSGGMDRPYRMAFGPDGDLYVSALDSSQILRFGTEPEAVFTVSLSTPSNLPVTVTFATANGSATAGSDYTASSGTISFAPWNTSKTIRVPVLDDATYEAGETFGVNLSNSFGAALADGQGIATITDNDTAPTKFYVVNDATTNLTYEYGATGTAIENYTLNGGNTAPRGAASNAAGTTVWVVDKNKKVYVYNPSGGLLGSWTAGSLASNATVEGVATNGTDVWIVDAKQDKVFKYTGAASRLTGSQNAASSFNLNSANSSPKDIVTDGVSLWVVNDSSTDKVFKYTLAGTLVGSWTISTSGAGSPTGITLDPTNVSAIWIVDSFADAVFQYTAAASRTSGSQSAATSFALAAGNTNPQGIADPPVPQAGATIGDRPHRARRSTESARVKALDNYLTTKLNDAGTRQSATIADRFVDSLFDLGQTRATLRALRRGLR